MRRKRFVKRMMALGVNRNFANYLARAFRCDGYSYCEAMEMERMAYAGWTGFLEDLDK